MKRQVASLLCGMLVISALAGCGDKQDDAGPDSRTKVESSQESSTEEDVESSEGGETGSDEAGGQSAYKETIPFTYTSNFSVNLMGSGIDYTQDSLYQYIVDRFNIEPEMWACEGSEASEKIQTWINTGSMPDALWYMTFGISSYKKHVEEGLLQALPDGWEDRWPNIAYAMDASGAKELLEIDGKFYAIPHSAWGLYSDVPAAYLATVMFYRKDLAKQVGMEGFGSEGTVTISELQEYLEKVQEAQLTPTVLDGANFWLLRGMENVFGTSENTIVEMDDGFLFIPQMDECKEMLKLLQSWYKAGLLDAEYYTKSDVDSMNSFAAGQSAAMPYGPSASDLAYVRELYEQGTGRDSIEDVGYVVVTADDGSMGASTEGYNYWTTTVFSPDTDEKTMERILDFTDWIFSKEGNTSLYCGIPGVDWEFDEDGKISMLNGAEIRDANNSPFLFLSWCPDEFSATGMSNANEQDIKLFNIAMETSVNAKTHYLPSANYENYQGDLRSNYSFPYNSKMIEIICTDVDVDSAWDDHLDEYRSLWEPFIEDLNKTYGYSN